MSTEDDIMLELLTEYTQSDDIALTILEKILELSSEKYKEILYQIIYELKLKKKTVDDVLLSLEKNHVLWEHEWYGKEKTSLMEQDDFIENPFEIAEGVIQCNCGSRRVFTFSKQVRSGDEGYTTFAECMSCKSKWSYKG